MTGQITSKLELREVLRAISANIREVVQCDLAVIALLDGESGNLRLYALDFPHSKGFVKEDVLICPRENDPGKRALRDTKTGYCRPN